MDVKERILTRDFALLFVASLAATSIYYLTMTFVARYAIEMFSVSEGEAGVAAALFMIGAIASRIVAGQIPRGRILGWTVGSMALTLASCLAYLATGVGFPLLLAVRFVHGLAFGVTSTLLPSLAIERLPIARIGEGTGYFMLSVTLGIAIGPLIGLLVDTGFDYQVLFGSSAVIVAAGFASIVVVARSRYALHGGKKVREPFHVSLAPAAFIDLKSWKYSLFMVFAAMAYTPINTFLAPYTSELGMPSAAPFVFLTYAVVLLASRPAAGRIMDRHGANAVAYPSLVSTAVGLLVCAAAQNIGMLLLVGVLMALGFGTTMSIGQAEVSRMAGGRDVSKAIATLLLFADAGSALGPCSRAWSPRRSDTA